MSARVGKLRSAAWLGWQIESNWADPFLFVVYTVARPVATALILAGMYWAVSGQAARAQMFAGFFVANAFHNYVTQVMIGMGWVIVEEREDYETLKYVYTSPIGMINYLAGRGLVKLSLGTVSLLVTLLVGWFCVGVRWEWGAVAWIPFTLTFAIGLVACLSAGFLVAGVGLLLPRIAVTLNEGVAIALYLACGVIFPIDLLPRGIQELTLVIPFTLWYEALRRFLLGHGSSARLADVSDLAMLGWLALSTAVFSVVALVGYRALETRARKLGRLDQTTMF
ncbi:MAG: ABC transporter permease [Candidatus Eisenbacteria bacterium]|uniref:ABC transporter permease n=1 Tax=Eiseniibacteriota bacterium TaxID=2212470 RepID=A0A849SKY1_UNCEI|nr:ABC transporter permease [Candidatus Eisenbacteria bacterium]